ncbi:hypothetical protein TNCV_4656511 [Trichonephila clavipes]|nr:hypothetical protein TNCV_4656511 [Trichonephila clavipes]
MMGKSPSWLCVKTYKSEEQHEKVVSKTIGPSKNRTFPSPEKVLSRGRRSCVECSEEVGEKGFLESGSPTFRIDSSGKDMRRTGFEGPDWRQTA